MREERRRPKRVGHLIRNALSEILSLELRGVATGLVTVTRVEVPADLKTACVYLSIFGPDDPSAVLAHLEMRAGVVRKLLAAAVKLKYNPELFFALDPSAEFSDRIDRILRSTKKNEPDTH